MTRGFQLAALMLLVATAACATLFPAPPPERDAAHRLERGLAALHAGFYDAAFDDLAWVYSHCPGHEGEVRARIALAALELDPRNAEGRPRLGTTLLAETLQSPGAEPWVRPLLETGYLMALGLGAPVPEPGALPHEHGDADADHEHETPVGEAVGGQDAVADVPRVAALEQEPEPTYGCGAPVEARGWAAPSLPEIPGPSMMELLAESHAARDRAALRADTLAAQLEAVREQLRVTREELQRVRETLKP